LENEISAFLQMWLADKYENASKVSGGDGQITTYTVGPALATNKKRIIAICQNLNLPKSFQKMLIAYAFIETETLAASQRDSTKDPGKPNFCGQGGVNYGFLNLNYAMLKDIGVVDDGVLLPDRPWDSPLNQDGSDDGIKMLVTSVSKGIEMWGLDRYVSYVRGGTTLFNDSADYTSDPRGGTFKVTVFKTGFSVLIKMLDEDECLLTDDRRVCLSIPWV
jgi:hypothetical protein